MNPPRRILVIMLRRIGDVLLTTPAVRALKKLYPKASIDFLVESPADQVLEGNTDIRRVHVYDAGKKSGIAAAAAYAGWLRRIRREKYDWVIDYMGNPRSAMLTAFSGAAVKAGPGHVSHRWAYSHLLIQSEKACYTALEKIRVLKSLGLSPDETDFLPKLSMDIAGTSPMFRRMFAEISKVSPDFKKPPAALIGFVPASRKITRQWPASGYAALGRMLRDRVGAAIVVFWGPGEEGLAREIAAEIGNNASAAPQTESLKELAELMSQCRLVVTNCNGPKHIAVALGVPTLTIHGSSDPAAWNPPDNPRHQVVRLDDLHCIGCRLNECPYHLECMNQLTPERVFERAESMIMNQRSSYGPS